MPTSQEFVDMDHTYGVLSTVKLAATKLQRNKIYRKIQKYREGLLRPKINFPTFVTR